MGKTEVFDYHGAMLQMQSNLICLYDEFLERDAKVVIDRYLEIYDDCKRIPLYTEIQQKILDMNYDVCFNMCTLKFEVEDEAGMRMIHDSERDFNDDKFTVISSMSQDMLNDILWSYSEDIRKNIKRLLFKEGVIFEDDDLSNPLLTLPIMDIENYCVLGGDAQQVMFPDLHLDIFKIRKDVVGQFPFKLSNFTIERKEGGILSEYRRTFSNGEERKVLS